ncbi:Two-component sensor histidine kinase, contains HisKA and HATPase domains [Reichenbachiella agariperforans]|uniref:histidine kinase n=1 Tax=Reichenbachiella agariperforans TaxID=156994 RepID=A0A1M6JP97_REIAG|nr:tetratricopeptide repeat protein [Reichenbachiella agariperforans]SHJ48466.1 Two-component sensor histidine kinase, contains HisKA and HATPase domains [Reichenbachiella agariperforans]
MRNTALFWHLVVTMFVMTNDARSNENIDSLRHALSLHKEDTSKVQILNDLSYAYFYQSNDSSIWASQEALSIAKKINDQAAKRRAFYLLGLNYHNSGQFEYALDYYDSSLVVNGFVYDSAWRAIILNDVGKVYRVMSRYPKALESHLEALKIRRALGDTIGVSNVLNSIGTLYFRQKNYDKALNYYQQTLDIQEYMGVLMDQASTLGNIGLIHMSLENYPEALNYSLQSYRLLDSLGESCRLPYPAINIGHTYLELGRLDEALQYLKISYDWSVVCHIPEGVCQSLYSMGQIYFKQGQYDLAEQKWKEGYELAEEYDLKTSKMSLAESLFELYKSKGASDQALHYLEITFELNTELFNEGMTEQLTTLELNYTFEQERDSLEFQKQSELLSVNAQLDQQRLMKYVTIAGLLITLIFTFVIYRYYRLSQKAKSILQKKNKTISEALDEREVLLREIHHRVKNNLQVVSSLLNIQSKYLNDELAKKAVLEGRNRVQSMALVHEKLYQSENLSQVNVKEYLHELANTLFQSYDVSEERVRFSSKIEMVDLSIDTTIQIGLIINELVSNALKYAFPDTKQGVVSLSLRKVEEIHELEVSDDGVGIASPDDLLKSYGYRIVRSISRGLGGTITMQHEKGTTFRLTF